MENAHFPHSFIAIYVPTSIAWMFIYCKYESISKEYKANYIVAYLLKAKTVEAEKQPLLGYGPYTRSRGTRHVRCDVTQQYMRCCKRCSLWIRAALIAMQLCGKHIFGAVSQHTTIEDAVFSVGPPRGYITRISRS
jgi:hypothetical protein